MDLLGVGPLELIAVLFIALLVFGPKDLARGARSLGQLLNRVVRSDGYRVLTRTSDELRNLPNRLMREANLEELRQTEADLKAAGQSIAGQMSSDPYRDWRPPAAASAPPAAPAAPSDDSPAR